LSDSEFDLLLLHLRGVPPVVVPPVASDTWSVARPGAADGRSGSPEPDLAPEPPTRHSPLARPRPRRELTFYPEDGLISLDTFIMGAEARGWSVLETDEHPRFAHPTAGVFLVPRRAHSGSTALQDLKDALQTT